MLKYVLHILLTALCPGLRGWAGTSKAKPIWILLKQETVSGSGISWAICKSAPCSGQKTMPAPHHSVFLQAGCPSCRPTNSIKALKTTALKAYHIISYQKFTSRVADICAAVSRRGYRIPRAEICVNMVQNCLKPTTPSRSTRIRTHGWCHSVGNQMVKETKPDRSR